MVTAAMLATCMFLPQLVLSPLPTHQPFSHNSQTPSSTIESRPIGCKTLIAMDATCTEPSCAHEPISYSLSAISIPENRPRAFSDLPDELQILAFERLLQEGKPSDLLRASVVCRRWSEICLPILWTHISVTNGNLIRLVRCIETSDTSNRSFVRSLSIYIAGYPRRDPDQLPYPSSLSIQAQGYSKLQVTRDLLRVIPGWNDTSPEMSSMENRIILYWLARLFQLLAAGFKSLQNFAFQISHMPTLPLEQWLEQDRIFPISVPSGLIKMVLNALPKACISLEIDDGGRISRPVARSDHVCSSLRDIMPRLKYLRLHLGYTCPCLFDPAPERNWPLATSTFENMESLSISLSWATAFRWMTSPIEDRSCDLTRLDALFALPVADNHPFTPGGLIKPTLSYQNALAASLRRIYIEGRFTRIKKLVLFNAILTKSRDWKIHHYTLLGMIKNEHKIIPVFRIASPEYEGLVQRCPWYVFLKRYSSAFFSDEGTSEVHFAPSENARALDSSWIAIKNNIRYPADSAFAKALNVTALETLDRCSRFKTMDAYFEEYDSLFPGIRESEKIIFADILRCVSDQQEKGVKAQTHRGLVEK